MNQITYNRLPCLPTPQSFLRRKRQTIQNKHSKINKYINDLKWKLYAAQGMASDLEHRYHAIDYQLAEIDGRLKREKAAKEEVIKAKNAVKNKVTSLGYTTEQIAAIASALNIKLES